MFDLDIFDDGVKSISDFGKDDLMPHLIYCGFHYLYPKERREKLKEIISRKMRKYGIKSSILTMLYMARLNLVTQEKVKKAAEGKLKNERYWKHYKGSINDDLESFLISLRNKNEIKPEIVLSFFLPKLTNEELNLVQGGNEEHLNTYEYHSAGRNPDVDIEEMTKSDSKSKYVHTDCLRGTILLTLEIIEIEDKTKDKLHDVKTINYY